MASAISLAGGMALGLASSLHCIGMCGGISVMLGYSGGCASTKAAMGEQAMLHGGRIISYTALGAVAGGLGTAALGPISAATGHEMLRWAAALSLGWIGLATAGLAPVPAFSRTATAPLRRLTRPLMRGLSSMPPNVRRMAGGLAWGLMPCGMVYGALLFALFAGTVSGGAGVMIGFGLGTLPALIAANMSFHRLQTVLRGQHAQRWMGGAMMLIAMLSLVDDPARLGAYCMHLIS